LVHANILASTCRTYNFYSLHRINTDYEKTAMCAFSSTSVIWLCCRSPDSCTIQWHIGGSQRLLAAIAGYVWMGTAVCALTRLARCRPSKEIEGDRPKYPVLQPKLPSVWNCKVRRKMVPPVYFTRPGKLSTAAVDRDSSLISATSTNAHLDHAESRRRILQSKFGIPDKCDPCRFPINSRNSSPHYARWPPRGGPAARS
jgi:hypothetical protein